MSENEIKDVLGTKLGTTQTFNEENRVAPITIAEVGPCVATQVYIKETDDYDAVQVAYGEIDLHRVSKPEAGHSKKAGVTSCRHSVEIRAPDTSSYEVGQSVGVDISDEVEYVDVIGMSKGHGSVDGMKHHGLAGQGATHGNQIAHRCVGGIDACATSGRVFKGKCMADRMGNDRATTQNLKIQKVDVDTNLLFIKGVAPGAHDGPLVVKAATKGGVHA